MKIFFYILFILGFPALISAQCPDLNAAMINSCGSEGNNEFVIFTTSVTAAASTYTLHYGTANPPATNALAGSDASAVTGTGSFTGTGCTIVNVTNPATSIPAGSRVMFISAAFDQAYDISSYCAGGTMYIVYIKLNAAGGTNSNWTVGGTMANSLGVGISRYLQVTYSGSGSCDATNAPVKSYMDMWASNADGNFVTWSGTTATYGNTGCTTVIPIRLSDFYVNYNSGNAGIYWQTATEINTDHFEIEKSFDGTHYFRVSNVPAAGNTSAPKNYSYTDRNIEYRATYYRLRVVDKDASAAYSKIVKINPSKSGFSINNLYPTPAAGNITLEWNSTAVGKAQITIRDISGRSLQVNNIQTRQGFNKYIANIDNIAKGTYIIEIAGEEGRAVGTFVKQ
jgi:hypothetical protein